MQTVKVAAAALNQTPLAWEQNSANIRAAISAAREVGVEILCLPELCVSGYGCEDAFLSPAVQRTALEVVQELLPYTAGMVVTLGLPMLHTNRLFNTVALIADREILGFSAKQTLSGDGVYYEPRWFKPWPRGLKGDVNIDGKVFPIGDIFYDIGGLRIGFEICEEAWVADRSGSFLARHGIDLILNPSASHFAFGRYDIRERFCLEGSRAFNCTYLYANLVGCEAGRIIYDGTCLIASGGELVARGKRFSFKEFSLTSAVVDIETTRMRQSQLASFLPDAEPTDRCIRRATPITLTGRHLPSRTPMASSSWERGDARKEHEFARAVALGLFDYLRKSKTQGFVVSLSGGADSSSVAGLVSIMVAFALSELGANGVQERLAHIAFNLTQTNLPAVRLEFVRHLLTCVYQRTENNSEATREAAGSLAQELGAIYHELAIDPLIAQYRSIVEQALGRTLSWGSDDLALQNLQARVRSPGVWLIANVKKALLLTTSNRSEAAVGYTTMDGDTSGGLNPIGGIDKAYLLRWLQWLADTGPTEHGPIVALKRVLAQPPTAELRPLSQHQTDEADLMPYEILDQIERLAIRDRKAPLEVLQTISANSVYNPEELRTWVERFFKLWSLNQWKRERYAPSFHLDDENLDPKTWCRFPILSGGYRRELKTLQQDSK